jgi:GDPmannose 4,6-dehydratase
MVLILNHTIADDFVVATGQTHTVRDLIEKVFGLLELEPEQFVFQNPKFLRPEELPYLRGDASKIKSILGWEPSIAFDVLVEEMVNFYMEQLTLKIRT